MDAFFYKLKKVFCVWMLGNGVLGIVVSSPIDSFYIVNEKTGTPVVFIASNHRSDASLNDLVDTLKALDRDPEMPSFAIAWELNQIEKKLYFKSQKLRQKNKDNSDLINGIDLSLHCWKHATFLECDHRPLSCRIFLKIPEIAKIIQGKTSEKKNSYDFYRYIIEDKFHITSMKIASLLNSLKDVIHENSSLERRLKKCAPQPIFYKWIQFKKKANRFFEFFRKYEQFTLREYAQVFSLNKSDSYDQLCSLIIKRLLDFDFIATFFENSSTSFIVYMGGEHIRFLLELLSASGGYAFYRIPHSPLSSASNHWRFLFSAFLSNHRELFPLMEECGNLKAKL